MRQSRRLHPERFKKGLKSAGLTFAFDADAFEDLHPGEGRGTQGSRLQRADWPAASRKCTGN